MLSLRSLAFILCSAIRRARALSCASLHGFADIAARKNVTKVARKIARKMATRIVQSPTNSLRLVLAWTGHPGTGHPKT